MNTCKHCGKEIPESKKENQFCNRSCAATYNNTKFPKRKRERNIFCVNCGKELQKSATKFCSANCQKLNRRKRVFEEIVKKGEIIGKNNRQAKLFLDETVGHFCYLCKKTEWLYEGKIRPIPLIMDHIDGDADNWKLDNIRLICGICEMFLPTYKSKNRGKGRDSTRQKYRTARYKKLKEE